jgi:hypothetical protein
MKEVIKQGNAVNLYYLDFLGMVMLRPVLVVWVVVLGMILHLDHHLHY